MRKAKGFDRIPADRARAILAAWLIAVAAYSAHRLIEAQMTYDAEARIHIKLLSYKPAAISDTVDESGASGVSGASESAGDSGYLGNSGDSGVSAATDGFDGFGDLIDSGAPDAIANADVSYAKSRAEPADESVSALKQINRDAVGWITLPGTVVDYPFVQAVDNAYYLGRDFFRSASKAGSVFMDFKNSQDFSDFNTFLYGHNMKNGSMFAGLNDFADQAFFDEYRTGDIVIEGVMFDFEIFAYARVKATDALTYGIPATDEEKAAQLKHIAATSLRYRDIGVTAQDKIVTLSTCTYEFFDARAVLIGRLTAR